MQATAKQLMTPTEAADYLGLSVSTLQLWRSRGSHPALVFVRCGRNIRYRRSDVDSFLDSQAVGET